MITIYPNEVIASGKKSKKSKDPKWEQSAVKHPGSLRKWAEKDFGLGKDEKLTISLLDRMHAAAEKSGNEHRIKQINLAKTFVRQGKKKRAKAEAAVATAAVVSILANAGTQAIVVAGSDGLDDHLAKNDRFETGKPVTIEYIHNDTSSSYGGSRFGKDVEPAGFYVLERDAGAPVPEGWSAGKMEIKNPLVLDWGSDSDGDTDSWKHILSDVYNATGAELTKKLLDEGYTHIVTLDDGKPTEIVALGLPKGKKGSDE